MVYQVLIAALLPIAILLIYIYREDKRSPEPVSQIIKAFFYGILSIFISLCISQPLEAIGAYTSEHTTISEAVSLAFFGAAIPEEIAKFTMLWLVMKKCSHFDERLDGIVYAVSVSLGFAALENILYLFDNIDSFISVGITRGLMSVPMHFSFGVLMGYFYSLAKFGDNRKRAWNLTLALLAPILAHGIYDAILMAADTMNQGKETFKGILIIAAIAFCIYLWKMCRIRIKELKTKDIEEQLLTAESFTEAELYTPQPLDCSDVTLPQELGILLEEMSENVHEVWAQGRIDEGWSFGPERNDDKKKHPCIVPYDKLSEQEKDYDRRTAEGTLKFIMKKGYRITKSEE
ncbi:MAG: PrsW family intramembrane metalloprotease [Bacteroidaceae bacterium]|nr:PrsW family intramembrane metalloprotease [Bacteroidaceae bacterium]